MGFFVGLVGGGDEHLMALIYIVLTAGHIAYHVVTKCAWIHLKIEKLLDSYQYCEINN